MYTLSSKDDLFNLFLLLLKTRRSLFRAREMELNTIGLTPGQCEIMYILKATGEKATQSDMARMTLREQHTISSIIDRMVKKGFIEKSKNPKQRNLVKLKITKKGKEAQKCAKKRESVHNIMLVLNEEERSQLYGYLERLLSRGITEIDKYRVSLYSS